MIFDFFPLSSSNKFSRSFLKITFISYIIDQIIYSIKYTFWKLTEGNLKKKKNSPPHSSTTSKSHVMQISELMPPPFSLRTVSRTRPWKSRLTFETGTPHGNYNDISTLPFLKINEEATLPGTLVRVAKWPSKDLPPFFPQRTPSLLPEATNEWKEDDKAR